MVHLTDLIQYLNVSNNRGRRLLLHSCCGPCSSHCLEVLRKYFRVTVLYYNPNITFSDEYNLRVVEQQRLIDELNKDADNESIFEIEFVAGRYDANEFYQIAKGYERCPEGGERCRRCFELRFNEAVKYADAHNFLYLMTTLTISPYKDANIINDIGEQCTKGHHAMWVGYNFNAGGGYERSVELCEKYNLYQQDYCGCVYSKVEMQNKS